MQVGRMAIFLPLSSTYRSISASSVLSDSSLRSVAAAGRLSHQFGGSGWTLENSDRPSPIPPSSHGAIGMRLDAFTMAGIASSDGMARMSERRVSMLIFPPSFEG